MGDIDIVRRSAGGTGPWKTEPESVSPGGSTPGASIVRGPFRLSFDAADIYTGIPLFQPAEGDLILDYIADVIEEFETATEGEHGFYADFGDWLDGGVGLSPDGAGSPSLYPSSTRTGSFAVPNTADGIMDGLCGELVNAPRGFPYPVWLDGSAPLCVKTRDSYLPHALVSGQSDLYVITSTPADL